MTAETESTSTTASTDTAPTGGSAPDTAPATAATAAAPEGGAAPAEATVAAGAEREKRKRGRPKGSTARTTRVVELTLTVSGTADGEWQAELKRGTTWLARALPVSAGAVQKAAAELHAEISGPIEEVIGEARATREAKVAELEAQLEQAKKALAELE